MVDVLFHVTISHKHPCNRYVYTFAIFNIATCNVIRKETIHLKNQHHIYHVPQELLTLFLLFFYAWFLGFWYWFFPLFWQPTLLASSVYLHKLFFLHPQQIDIYLSIDCGVYLRALQIFQMNWRVLSWLLTLMTRIEDGRPEKKRGKFHFWLSHVFVNTNSLAYKKFM